MIDSKYFTKSRDVLENGGRKALLSKIFSLNVKIKQGVYKFKEVKCFCGEDNSMEVTNKDRYGIFYSLHLCRNCGLMFAKNQMTEESAKEFYEKDYRGIYDFGLDLDKEFEEKAKSIVLTGMLEDAELDPKVIFEIGCNDGSFLMPVKDKEVYGVDYNREGIKRGLRHGIPLTYGGIEELEKLNKKADLIVLNHVLEHYSDLEKELERISHLLAEGGMVYIAVPSFYGSDCMTLFQNAHNWQFTVNTLEYVMNCCGYKMIDMDNLIHSLWYYDGVKGDRKSVCPTEAKDIWGYGFSGKDLLPRLTSNCKFSLKDRRRNVSDSLSYKFPDLRELHNKEVGNSVVVVSGGPSINNYKDKIRDMKRSGHKVISIDRMYKWCLDNGIEPDYVVVLDGDDDVVESFTKLNKNTTHIMASICQKSICEILKDYKTYIYSSQQAGVALANEWDKNQYDKVTVLNSGGSVSLACLVISAYLGMRDIHIFGFDCHLGDGEYAKGIAGKGALNYDRVELKVDDVKWTTILPLVSFAQQFFHIYKLLEANEMLGSIKIYGKSLIKAMSKINFEGDK
jgi:2-polyprenyl-3-methyl-5-hydroxy-6-metoxy-1,4-benzoquinol methylase/uncharacterized Rossmann fold enzyme